MNMQSRELLLVVSLAAAVAAPAFGQATAPAVGPGKSAKESGAPTPDFSGIWMHSNGFEPLRSGPTSLVNLSRRGDGIGNGLRLVGDYKNPILNPEAAEAHFREAHRLARNDGERRFLESRLAACEPK